MLSFPAGGEDNVLFQLSGEWKLPLDGFWHGCSTNPPRNMDTKITSKYERRYCTFYLPSFFGINVVGPRPLEGRGVFCRLACGYGWGGWGGVGMLTFCYLHTWCTPTLRNCVSFARGHMAYATPVMGVGGVGWGC